MKNIKIAHLADFHLGSKFFGKNSKGEDINKNLIKTLEILINILNSSKIQLLLIAGDFYETSNIDSNLLSNIKEIFSRFGGEIIISPGNHDYISLESSYIGEWPKNTHIFMKEEIEYIEFSDINTRVYGFAFNSSHITKRMLKDFPNIDERFINLGVFHGQIDSKINQYNPIFLEDIENSRLDYIALGHVHKRSEIQKIGDTYYAYSGNPVGRGFDETGKKGIYIGAISKLKNNLEFLKMDNSEFYIDEFELKSFESQTYIAESIRDFLKNSYGEGFKNNYYRIFIKGFIKEEENINLDIIHSKFLDVKYIEFIDDTSIYIYYDALSKENSLKGNFVNNVKLNEDLTEKEKEKILDYGMRAFEGLL